MNQKFEFNKETEFIPIVGLLSSQLNAAKTGSGAKKSDDSDDDTPAGQPKHHPALIQVLAEELSVAPEEIHDFELCVFSERFCNAILTRNSSDTFTIHNQPRSGG